MEAGEFGEGGGLREPAGEKLRPVRGLSDEGAEGSLGRGRERGRSGRPGAGDESVPAPGECEAGATLEGDEAVPAPGEQEDDRAPEDGGGSVFIFNPFAEGYIARGKGFMPVKHQAMLAEDLANLPQFLCGPGDIVLLGERPSAEFLNELEEAGFSLPEFVEVGEGGVDPVGKLSRRKLGSLRPWAWGPDSVKLLEPLFGQVGGEEGSAERYFNPNVARLYSKAWSAEFLRQVFAWCSRGGAQAETLVCGPEEIGVAVDTVEAALEAVAAIRARGHHRVVVKEAHGLAGSNAIRLWEPEALAEQKRWLECALGDGKQVVVEPWLERELDFSVQLEMARERLKLCGYTGLVNDRKGQYVANWAEADYRRCVPSEVARLFPGSADVGARLGRLFEGIVGVLEDELRGIGFMGPVSIDAFVYRTAEGGCRVKPVVEINPRYTMGRVTVELMKHVVPGNCGVFRLVSRGQARAAGFAELGGYGRWLMERSPLRVEGKAVRKIREGAICLNDPRQAQVCLATFEVSPILNLPGRASGSEPQGS